jgi:GNAT superfamily N-acetyltransferase
LSFFIKPVDIGTIRSATRLICEHIHEETGQPANYDGVLDFVRSCGDDTRMLFVACRGHHTAGVVVGSWNGYEGHYEVRSLYVEPAYRGSNCAQLLLQALLDWAGEEDAPVLIATTGEPRPFYRALGFEPTHIISRASLKTLRERLGDRDGKCNRPDHRGGGRAGADEPGEERAAAAAGV